MTKYYTSIASFEVAMHLKDLGYSKTWGYQYNSSGKLVDPAAPAGLEGICEAPTYAEVFDWLLDKGLSVEIEVGYNGWNSQLYKVCNNLDGNTVLESASWHSAADAAILKAVEILKKL